MKLFLLFSLFLAALTYTSSSSPSGRPSVIIISAGMSGMSAAKRLEDAGIKDFLILEATNRIGGRIKKTEFAGYTVETGANWLAGVGGPKRNPLYEMSKQIHLKKFFSDFSNVSFNTYKQEDPRTKLERMIDFFIFDGEQAEASRVTRLKHVLPSSEDQNFGEKGYFVADSRGFESLVHLIAKQFLSYENGVINDPRVKFNQLWKRRAISEFSTAVYTKIFLKFPRTFWPTGNGTEFFFYVHERRGYYAFWQHLENEHPGSNIMFVTVVDDIRVEQQSDEETKVEVMEVLRNMFGKNIPEATNILIPRWKSDRFYRGSFTNWPVGYPQKRHDQLRAPIGRIYFKGEHTHPKLYGYADGAYYAGIDTAKDVIKCLKNRICKGVSTTDRSSQDEFNI